MSGVFSESGSGCRSGNPSPHILGVRRHVAVHRTTQPNNGVSAGPGVADWQYCVAAVWFRRHGKAIRRDLLLQRSGRALPAVSSGERASLISTQRLQRTPAETGVTLPR